MNDVQGAVFNLLLKIDMYFYEICLLIFIYIFVIHMSFNLASKLCLTIKKIKK